MKADCHEGEGGPDNAAKAEHGASPVGHQANSCKDGDDCNVAKQEKAADGNSGNYFVPHNQLA